MKIGLFDDNTLSWTHLLVEEAEENCIHIRHIFNLSYVGEKDENDGNPFDLDVLIVNPTLNRVQWKNLLECVKKNQQVKFIFCLTPQSAEDFDLDHFGDFPNVESYINFDEKYARIKKLFEEALST